MEATAAGKTRLDGLPPPQNWARVDKWRREVLLGRRGMLLGFSSVDRLTRAHSGSESVRKDRMSARNLSPGSTGAWMADAEARRSGQKLAGLFLLALAFLAGVGLVGLSHLQAKARLSAHRELSAIADLKLQQLTQWRQERLSDAYFFSHARFAAADVRKLLDAPQAPAVQAEVRHWLNLLKGGERYHAVAVYSARGERLVALSESAGEPAAGFHNLVDRASRTHDLVITDLHRDQANGFIHLDILFPIFEEADWTRPAAIAFVLLKVDARQYLFPVVQSWPTPSKTAEAFLVRREGENVLFLSDLRHRRDAALQLQRPWASPALPAARVLAGETKVLEGIDYRGMPVVAAGRMLPGTSWAIVSKMDREEIYAPLRQQTLAGSAILGTLVLAVSFFVALRWRQRSSRFLKRELAERRAHQREMERMNRLYAALSRINQALVRARCEDEFLKEICRTLVDSGGCQMTWVGWVDEDKARVIPVAQAGDQDAYLQRVGFPVDGKPETRSFLSPAIREGKPHICNDLLQEPPCSPCRRIELKEEWRSLAAFPVRREGRVKGVLAVYAGEKNFFGEQERALIQEAADDLSFGVDNLLARERRRQAEQALRQREEQLRAAALAGEIGVWSWAPGTSHVVVTANWRRLFGVGPQEPVTFETWRDLLHPEDRERTLRELNSAAEERRDYSCEYRVVRPDGTVRWLADRGRASYDETGTPTGMAGVNVDVTERKFAEEAIRKARDELAQANADLESKIAERTGQLVEANASLEAFAHTAAHDMRSPLRSILNFSGIVLQDYGSSLAAEGHFLLERVVASAEQMNRLLNDLLEFSKMNRAELKLECVALGGAVGEALALLEADIKAKNAVVTVAEPLPDATAHPATLVLLINNLVSNALKFTQPGVQPQVRLWAERSDGNVKLFVQDNGIGIETENLERIFAPFERLHGKQTYPGTGLGLAIVRKGAQRMGGRAGVESEFGKGSRFWLELQSV